MSLTIKMTDGKFTAIWQDRDNEWHSIVEPMKKNALIEELSNRGVPIRDVYDEFDRVDPSQDEQTRKLEKELDQNFQKKIIDSGFYRQYRHTDTNKYNK